MAVLFAVAATPALACGDLNVSAAWVRAAPPGMTVMAGYLTLANDGDQPVALLGARSADFEGVEFHTMSQEDGVMRMRRIGRLNFAPGEQKVLEPGGMHIMLIGPKRTFAVGEQVEIQFDLCGEHTQLLRLPVREGGTQGG